MPTRKSSRPGPLVVTVLLGVLAPAGVAAQTSAGARPAAAPEGGANVIVRVPFPGYQGEPAYAAHQELLDGYWNARRYGEAHRVAMKGLVWRGDKHAQYMVGYMYYEGVGVARDPVRACAWFTLAAERGDARLGSARDAACAALPGPARKDAAALHGTLLAEYGDRSVIRRLIQRDERQLRDSMASHPTLRDGNLRMVTEDGYAQHGSEWYADVQRRIDTRLMYLEGHVELGELTLVDEPEPPED